MGLCCFSALFWLLCVPGCSNCSGSHSEEKDKKGNRDAEVVRIIRQRDASVDEKNIIEEKEPNNYPHEAQPLQSGKSARGYISRPFGPNNEKGDRDFYKFTIPKGKSKMNLWARVTGVPGLRIVLEIRDGKNYERLFVASAPRKGRSVTLTNLVLSPGDYYFRVRERWTGKIRRYNLKSPYLLRWKVDELKSEDEVEPNESFHEATETEVNKKKFGYLGREDDVDIFRVQFGDLKKEAGIHVSISSLKSVAVRITLYDGLMNQLLERTGKRGMPLVFRNLKIPRHQGFFFVKLESAKGFNPEERYTLNVGQDSAAGGAVEQEPNDTRATAMFLDSDQGEIFGILESKDDKDTFRLNVTSTKSLRLSVKPKDEIDVAVSLYDKMGRPLLATDAGRRGYEEKVPNFRVRPGDLFIQVRSSKKNPEDTGRYVFSWNLVRVEKGDEIEPNNKKSQATLLIPGVSARGFVYPSGDIDYYRFRLRGRGGTTGRVHIAVQGIPNVRLKVSLLDGVENVLRESDKHSFAGIRKMEVNLHVGKWYFLKVEDFDGRRSNPNDSYELEVIRKW